ncbi:cytochrome P450 3A56 isoform X3 [Astyanax mexicanus]|uniref:cytochrome P450 3A56 isoform X3 n=1 Tax=Astyanax mexicanus TaxID=7994 RepID=UPI0020CABC6D|nr:cytochrome P450 3A56 isoform X3 [Astyanax mexicanus]
MDYFWIFSAETWTLLLLFTSLLLLYGTWNNKFFVNLGIPGPKPLPVFGNLLEYRKGFHVFDMECYRKYGKIWGFFEGRDRVLCIVDKSIVKSILVKECYTYFTNRRDFGMNGELYDALFVTKDEDWKRIRNHLSPSFTSGRLKEMFGIIQTHANTLVKNLEKSSKNTEGVAVKEVFGAYSMDVITSTAFSVDIDSMNNPDDPFVTNIKKLLDFDVFSPLFLLAGLFPFLIPLLEKMKFSLFPAAVADFFFVSLKKIKAERKAKNHKSRVDILQLMVDSQTEGEQQGEDMKKGLTDHEILSQSMIFIFAGYETSSSTLSFFFYNIATNPETMKKLQQEIDQTFPNNAPVQYDAVMNMEYLDAALNESMRLFPSVARLERVCKETIEINGLTIPQGTSIMIPVFPLHRDPEYWPDPSTFNPERFTKGNKENIDPYVYMPFGSGPRNCIGMRFALLAMKLAIVEILQRFNVINPDPDQVPLKLGTNIFLAPKDPIKLKFPPRANPSTTTTQQQSD